jgi:IS5 family transposase
VTNFFTQPPIGNKDLAMINQQYDDKAPSLFPPESLVKQLRLNQNHPLIILAMAINWPKIEAFMLKFFNLEKGRRALRVRLLVGLIILKFYYNLSDGRVIEQWTENMYFQAFTGQPIISNEPPCDPSELSRFRSRIGEEGCKMILSESVNLFGPEALEAEVIADTTVQEKFTKFPTDFRLALDVWKLCLRIAVFYKIPLRRTYGKAINSLKKEINFSKGRKSKKAKKAALKKLRALVNKVLRDLKNKLQDNCPEVLEHSDVIKFFDNAYKAINQQKNDKNKIYSIFEPQVCCIAKGKTGKPYEFGNKVSLVIGKIKGVILGAMGFEKNLYDGDTLAPALSQLEELHEGYRPEVAIVDRGYRNESIDGTRIVHPIALNNEGLDEKEKVRLRERRRRRSSVEPIIGRVKYDHRMGINFLRGKLGDLTNPILAAVAFNMKKYASQVRDKIFNPIKRIGKKLKRKK